MKSLIISLILLNAGILDSKLEDIVLYQIVTDRFYDGDKSNNFRTIKGEKGTYHGGDFRGIIDNLDYLQGLGINAIWISPVIDNIDKPVSGAGFMDYGYHGYWPDDFERIEENFGTMEELKSLVKEGEKRGIKTIIDVVVNHAGYGSRWEERREMVRSKVAGGCGPPSDPLKMCLFGLPDFRTEEESVREFLIETYSKLQRESGCHGFRIDAAKHVDMTFLESFRDRMKQWRNDFILIGEIWGAGYDNEILTPYLQAGVFDSAFDFSFVEYLKGFVTGRLRARAFNNYIEKGDRSKTKLLSFLNNHDTTGFLFSINGDKKRFRIAATLLLTLPSIPVIYYGDEVGRIGGEWPFNRSDMVWGEAVDSDILWLFRKLIKLRRENPSLTGGSIEPLIVEDGLYAFLRKKAGKMAVLVMVNRDEKPHRVRIPFPEEGAGRRYTLIDYFSKEKYQKGDDGFLPELDMDGVSFRIFLVDEGGDSKGTTSKKGKKETHITDIPLKMGRPITLRDPSGDDYGPGNYLYPVHPRFMRGDLDLIGLVMTPFEDETLFEVEIGGRFIVEPVRVYQDRFEDFLFQTIDIYIDTDGMENSGCIESLPGRNIVISERFAWEKGILISGSPFRVAERLRKVAPELRERFLIPPPSSIIINGGRCRFRVPVEWTGKLNENWGIVMLLSCADYRERYDKKFGVNGGKGLFNFPVRPHPDEFSFGGCDLNGVCPHVIDILDSPISNQKISLSSFDPKCGRLAKVYGVRIGEKGTRMDMVQGVRGEAEKKPFQIKVIDLWADIIVISPLPEGVEKGKIGFVIGGDGDVKARFVVTRIVDRDMAEGVITERMGRVDIGMDIDFHEKIK